MKRRNIAAVPALLAAVLLLAAIAVDPAQAAGYWTCAAGAWTAVGEPTHARPDRPCEPRIERPRSRAACLEARGRWGPRGLSPRPICTLPTRDGGRVCADNGECDGSCVATLTPEQDRLLARQRVPALGRCTARTPVFGCRTFVERGVVRGTLCRD